MCLTLKVIIFQSETNENNVEPQPPSHSFVAISSSFAHFSDFLSIFEFLFLTTLGASLISSLNVHICCLVFIWAHFLVAFLKKVIKFFGSEG